MNYLYFKKHSKQSGSFLLELMIGLLVSIVTVLSIMTIYTKFEAQKRTTSQMSQAVANGALALFPVVHYGKMAGYGINNSTIYNCNVNAWKNGTTFNFSLAPVKIRTSGNNNTSDTIEFTIGNSDNFFSPVKLTQNMPNSSAVFKVDSRFGLKEGDLVIVGDGAQDCTLAQVSELPSSNGANSNVIHSSGNYTDPKTGGQVPTQYNKPSGLGINYNTGASLFNLGSNPQHLVYSVLDNQLVQVNDFGTTNERTIIGDNIVMMKAIYGIDTGKNGDIDEWTSIAPTDLSTIHAIRVAIISRSSLKEKADNGVCNITTNADFVWANGTMNISNLPDWGCYRYRMYQTTVPLLNMMWGN